MPYKIFKLHFPAGMHIGLDVGGNTLARSRSTFHSDTLFSALCCMLAASEKLKKLYEYFQSGQLRVSDALPFLGNDYYLPKPLDPTCINRDGFNNDPKLLKQCSILPLPKSSQELFQLQKDISFGIEEVHTHAAIDRKTGTATPYFVSTWRFVSDAGLYIIVQYHNDEAISLFIDSLGLLSATGIGGKTSSGVGKFTIQIAEVPAVLKSMLENEKASCQLLIGTALPDDSQLEQVLKASRYEIVERGGYIYSSTFSPKQVRKKTLYQFAPGSCFKSRFTGNILEIGGEGKHPVWRLTDSLFLGVNVI